MKRMIFALFLLPLAACVDADMVFDIKDENTAQMSASVTMGPEMYGMVMSSGEDPCPDGEGVVNADGSYTCNVVHSDTIDNLIAEIDKDRSDDEMPMDMAQGLSIEKLADGQTKVVFDLTGLRDGASDAGADPAMLGAFMQQFEGHGMKVTVRGDEVVDTNGTLSADGKSAEFYVPLTAIITPDATIPDQFFATVQSN